MWPRSRAEAAVRGAAALLAAAKVLAAAAMLALPSQAAAAARPNIVLIVADDLGYTDLGSYGGEIRTPNLDALAAEGTRFASFHVAGECSPTRAMLLTGLNSHRSGVGAMRESVPREFEGKPGYLTVLDRKVVTLSSLLQRGGYRTYAVGKWHVGKESYNLPPARGFDRSLVQGDSGSDNWDPAQRYLALTDRVYWFEDGAPARMPKEYYSTSFFVDKALEYLQQDWATRSSTSSLRDGPQPFFLYLAFQANHIPLQAPAAFVAKQQGRYDVGWEVIRARRHPRLRHGPGSPTGMASMHPGAPTMRVAWKSTRRWPKRWTSRSAVCAPPSASWAKTKIRCLSSSRTTARNLRTLTNT
jgi:arylsulfatase/uncharacterized sulfatase